MLGTADDTPYDLRFRLLDIPVRVNPWFWLVMALISGENQSLLGMAVFVACAFVSILVHEFGHGLSSRALGVEPTGIVLYGMGGYCQFHDFHRSAWRRVVILLCGPGAGFALLGLVVAAHYWSAVRDLDLFRSEAAQQVVNDLIKINLAWGILNLFPIWPLDGGRIAEVVLGSLAPRNGVRWAHVISLLTAGGFALWLFSLNSFMTAIWFGYFAYVNYQILQAMHDAYRTGDSWRY
jgi:Zn-dependent protease